MAAASVCRTGYQESWAEGQSVDVGATAAAVLSRSVLVLRPWNLHLLMITNNSGVSRAHSPIGAKVIGNGAVRCGWSKTQLVDSIFFMCEVENDYTIRERLHKRRPAVGQLLDTSAKACLWHLNIYSLCTLYRIFMIWINKLWTWKWLSTMPVNFIMKT